MAVIASRDYGRNNKYQARNFRVVEEAKEPCDWEEA